MDIHNIKAWLDSAAKARKPESHVKLGPLKVCYHLKCPDQEVLHVPVR